MSRIAERKKFTRHQCIYLAGLFDGEGTVVIERLSVERASRPGSRTPQFNLRAKITNTNRTMIEWLKHTFGGSAYPNGRPNRNIHALSWVWSVSCGHAAEILKRISPYVKIKAEEIRLALEFQEFSASHAGPYKQRGLHGTIPIPEWVVESKELYRKRMQELKKSYKQYVAD